MARGRQHLCQRAAAGIFDVSDDGTVSVSLILAELPMVSFADYCKELWAR